MTEKPSMAGQIGSATVIIMAVTAVDKILAIVKEMLTAKRFGIAPELDVFNVAYAFPGLVVLLFTGSLVAALVPLYLEWGQKTSPARADAYAAWLVYFFALFFALLALCGFFLSPVIISLLGLGFDDEKRQLGIALERLLIWLIFLDGMGIMLRGLLIARKKFFSLSLAPIFINLFLIFFLVADFGFHIYDLVWGFLLGTAFKTWYMVLALRRDGFLFRLEKPKDHSRLSSLWLLAIPMLGSDLIANANIMVDQIMATLLTEGAVSTLRYAYRVNDLPIQVVIVALTIAIFPYISEEAARGNQDNLKIIYKKAIIFLGFITIPLIFFVSIWAREIVALLFQRGAFDAAATEQTAATLVCYSWGLFFYAYTYINGSFFAALKSTKTLFQLGLFSIVLNVLLNYLFMNLLGVKGIALSTSVTLGILMVFFVAILKRRLGMTDLPSILPSLGRILLGAVLMAVASLPLKMWAESAVGHDLLILLMAAAFTGLVYGGAVWVSRTPELEEGWVTLMAWRRSRGAGRGDFMGGGTV